MIDSVDILFGESGQTLTFVAPEGRPSSVSDAQVWDDTMSDLSTEEDAVGAPTIDTVNTTFDADSGVSETDQTKCNLTATTNIAIGRRYLATNDYGAKEWIEVERIESGVAVHARTPLTQDFNTGDAFASTLMTVTLDPDWVSDVNNLSNPRNPRPHWRLVWTYTVAGKKYRAATFFNLTRYPFVLTVSAIDVDQLSRGMLARLHPDDVRGAGDKVLDEAKRQVRLDLWERELTDSAFRNNEIINELIRWRAVWVLADQAFLQGGIGADQVTLAEKRYADRFASLVTEPRGRIQRSGEGDASVHSRAPIMRR